MANTLLIGLSRQLTLERQMDVVDNNVANINTTADPTDHDISIAADGNVSVLEGVNRVDSVRGKLRLVSFAQAQRLLKEGSNLFSAGEGNAAQPDITSKVNQGFVEKSNVNSVVEMSRMIEVTRTYTQISAMLQQQGDLQKSALDKLAEVPA